MRRIQIKKILKYALYLTLIGLMVNLFIEPLYTPTAIPTNSHMFHFPRVIVHKSNVSGDFPGNSIEAIQEALGTAVEGIEVDVRNSKDNILFLYYGDTLEEYTNGCGKPEDYDWKQLSHLHYKAENKTPLITLDEFLKMVGHQKFIFLDVKSDNLFNKQLAQNITNLIKKYHLEEKVFVESFNPFFLVSMRLKARDIMLMYDILEKSDTNRDETQPQFDKLSWFLKNNWFQKQVRRVVRPEVLGLRFNTNQNILADLIGHSYPIITWTVDDPKVAIKLYNLGVKGIQTNQPSKLLSLFSGKKKVIFDAGGSRASMNGFNNVRTINDIVKFINLAAQNKKKVTIAGRRHSMGGQTLLDHSYQLDMLNFNKVRYNSQTKTLIVQAGATWKKIQNILDRYNRSIAVMQSDNIFTVGGSISVNVHGWQVGFPPIASTILSMTVVTADGKIRKVSMNSEPELYKSTIGGYGLFAVIAEVELITVENSNLIFHAKFAPLEELANYFEQYITKNPAVELAYTRLSIDQKNLFDEFGLFWFEKSNTENHSIKTLGQEKFVALKRGVFRTSQYWNFGKKVRWMSEKIYANMMKTTTIVSRNNAMNTDIHILWPLYGNDKDILHEYFIPKQNISFFINALRNNIKEYNVNVLNVTIREVRQDNISFLPYAAKDVFGLVCLFSQRQTDDDEIIMKNFTKTMISKAVELNGTFYLPYRLHFNKELLLKAYPNINDWIALKKKYDPKFIFDSLFFEYIITTIGCHE